MRGERDERVEGRRAGIMRGMTALALGSALLVRRKTEKEKEKEKEVEVEVKGENDLKKKQRDM